MHVSGEGEAAHQGKPAEDVDHVVDVETIARAQALADARGGAIEGVAEPVEGEAGDCAESSVAVPGGQGIAGPGADLGSQAQSCQVVGADAIGNAGGQPEQGAFFGSG